MSERWLSTREALDVTGWSRAKLLRLRGGLAVRKTASAGPGRAANEYLLSSLPADAQAKYFQRLGPAALALPASASDAPVVQLGKEEYAEAKQRFAIISPLIEFRGRARNGAGTVKGLAAALAAQHGVSARTLFRWLDRYDNGGFPALADRPRKDKGDSRFFRRHPLAKQFLENKILNEGVSIQIAYEELCAAWGSEAMPYNHDSRPPAYSTIAADVRRWSKPLKILAREGEEAFRNKTSPYLVHDYDAHAPMELWVSDHVWHDVFVCNDCFGEVEYGKALRLWMTAIADWRSRKIVGLTWCVNPSSYSISTALRLALSQFGAPAGMIIDNGADYKKIAGAEENAMGVLQMLGIKVTPCKPYSPQGKNIESWFRTLHQRFDVLWRPWYAGTNHKTRPEACDEQLALHAQWFKQLESRVPADSRELIAESPLPKASEFIFKAACWIDEYNRGWKHRGRGMQGRTPDEVFNEGAPASRRKPIDTTVIAHLFWESEERTLQEGGCVRLYNEWFEPATIDDNARLFPRIGEKVRIACDPTDLITAVAMDQDRRFLARLVRKDPIARGPATREQMKASLRIRAQWLRANKQYLKHLAHARRQAGDLTALARLGQRAVANGPVLQMPGLPQPRNLRELQAHAPVEAPRYIDDVVADLMNDEERK